MKLVTRSSSPTRAIVATGVRRSRLGLGRCVAMVARQGATRPSRLTRPGSRPARSGFRSDAFTDAEKWPLDRVWLRREFRRRGYLTAVWPLWRSRYGDFT